MASCDLAPEYNRPSAPVPAAFKEGAPADPAAGVRWAEAQPRDDAVRGKWWQLYGDPVLDDLEEQVLVSNQTLLADVAAWQESRALVLEARSALFPTVSVSPSITDSHPSRNVGGGSSSGSAGGGGSGGTQSGGGGGKIYSLPFEASYEPDLWGAIRNTVAADVANAQASAGDLANARLSLQSQLAQDYFQVRALDEERRILDATVTAYRQELKLTAKLVIDGIDSNEDLAQARAQLDTAAAQATDLGVARAQFEHAIAVLAGKAPADFSLAVAKFDAVPPPVPATLPSELLERRPDIAAAERRVAAANAEIGVARAAYYPSLALTATAGFESSQASRLLASPSRFWTLGAQLSDTLLDFGYRRGENEQAREAYDQAVANYRQTVLGGFQSVEDNLAALRILTAELTQRKQAVNSTQQFLKLATTRFQDGIDSYLTLSAAQTANLVNEENAVITRLNLLQTSVALVQSTGGGWEASDLP